MSYILEALKKAQAERQLGHAPDIHAPAALHLPPRAAPANRKPLLIGTAAGLLLAALAGALAWRGAAQAPTPARPAVLAQAGASVSAPAAPVEIAEPAPEALPAPMTSEPAAEPVPVPAPAPAVPKAAPAPPPRPAAPDPATQEPVAEAVYLPAPARVAENPPAARAPEPVPEENLRTLAQLPEALQREVPKVAVGGYIYSPNPSDRLLLVDKVLRREGEELAPGLVLERLMPKYAVMNYRGTRYRVAY